MSGKESVLTECILKVKEEGRCARIPFVTGGVPDKDSFWDTLAELEENGADIIELGVPFSDPVADGPVIAAASHRALSRGVSLAWLLDGLMERKYKVPLVIMSYANPLLQYGWSKANGTSLEEIRDASLEILAEHLFKAGIKGVIIPDVPLDEAGPYQKALAAKDIDLIALVGPNTSLERMEEYAKTAKGYVYVVSVMGITGAREGLPPEAIDTLTRARSVFSLPLALGFGLKEPGQVRGLSSTPDAVIFGSALVKHLEEGKSAADFMKPWLVG
ncbi:MAG: tryptophan synthase subunit alpha [Deltaproteobacteria bacterium]|jgi:tryptophan synthase alpha chain|nr:tryptophan synthase subunit alpha [Deltaproteobacteria bacterium]